MDNVRAEELLRERPGELSADQLKAAVLLVTGDAKAAERAWRERVLRDTKAQCAGG